jgi:hypothetical protein
LGSKRGSVDGDFLKAGRLQEVFATSVSPLEKVVNEDEDLGGGGLPEGLESEGLERIGAEEEGEFIRNLVDPKLPSKREVGVYQFTNELSFLLRPNPLQTFRLQTFR